MTYRKRITLAVCALLVALLLACPGDTGRNVQRGGDVPPARTSQP